MNILTENIFKQETWNKRHKDMSILLKTIVKIYDTYSPSEMKKIDHFFNMLLFLNDMNIVEIDLHNNCIPRKIHVLDRKEWVVILRNFGCKISDETR